MELSRSQGSPEASAIMEWPVLQAHRGYHLHGAIENTLDALKSARKHGFQACEVDLQLNKDGNIVLHHDSHLRRIYNIDKNIVDLSDEDIKELEITTLTEILESDEVPDFLNLEIKNETFNNFDLEKKLCEVLTNKPFKKQVMLSSFNPLTLMYLQNNFPTIRRALLVSKEPVKGNPIYLRKMWFEPLVNYDVLNLDYKSFDRRILILCKERGIQLALWTLNDKHLAKKYVEMGVHSIITDQILPDDFADLII